MENMNSIDKAQEALKEVLDIFDDYTLLDSSQISLPEVFSENDSSLKIKIIELLKEKIDGFEKCCSLDPGKIFTGYSKSYNDYLAEKNKRTVDTIKKIQLKKFEYYGNLLMDTTEYGNYTCKEVINKYFYSSVKRNELVESNLSDLISKATSYVRWNFLKFEEKPQKTRKGFKTSYSDYLFFRQKK